ncbi:MAG: enoyl-CoA hydratase/isomerase family protein [Desulfurococcales archaeon]|nr:enoyl-CoA hydratase/isomerase family protein [Desulfurococcales archaeon]
MLRHSGLVSWVIVDRVDKANSLDYRHARELASSIRGACGNDGSRLVALRGAGDRFFSTGIDLGVVAGFKDDVIDTIMDGVRGVFNAIDDCGKPVVAAVNGHALGLGFELVLASDMAVAVEWARLGVPAARWGMIPPITSTVGPVLLGLKQASLLAYTGRAVDASEAVRLGIVNSVAGSIDDMESWVYTVASEVSKSSQWAVAEARRLARRILREVMEMGLTSLALSASRDEARERARRFFEDRRR